jgi:hypothetical protein
MENINSKLQAFRQNNTHTIRPTSHIEYAIPVLYRVTEEWPNLTRAVERTTGRPQRLPDITMIHSPVDTVIWTPWTTNHTTHHTEDICHTTHTHTQHLTKKVSATYTIHHTPHTTQRTSVTQTTDYRHITHHPENIFHTDYRHITHTAQLTSATHTTHHTHIYIYFKHDGQGTHLPAACPNIYPIHDTKQHPAVYIHTITNYQLPCNTACQ